jgi:hypothetical protein
VVDDVVVRQLRVVDAQDDQVGGGELLDAGMFSRSGVCTVITATSKSRRSAGSWVGR